jgi:porphobilinogen deaminase
MASRKEQPEPKGTWIVKDVPRDLMHRMKVAAAVERKTLKNLLFELAEAHLAELEKKGLLPKGK